MAGNFVDSLTIAIGLDTSQVAQGVKEVGAQLDSGLKSAVENAVKGASPLGKALGDFGKDAEERALKALNELGIRSAEQIQQKIAELQQALAKINASSTLTARDKQAAIDEITKKIGVLKNELERGIPQAAQQGFAGAEAAAGKFKGFISSIWAQISGPLLGAFAVGGTISSYISNSMAAGELAEKLKVDIEEIQIWSGAMDRAGGSAASLQATIEKLNASGKAQGDAIGVLLDLADKAETMSKEAFYTKAKELEIDEKTIEVLAQGRKALDEHLKRQKELGAYTKEDAENSKKFKQSLADLLQAWDGFTSFIGRFTVPMMRWLADVLTDVVIFMRQHTPFVVAAISLIGAALAVRLMPPLRELPKLIAGVSKAFLRWMPFVAVIAALALLIDDFWTYLQGGESELEEFWAIFGTGPEILAALNSAWEETKNVLAAIGTGLAQLVRYWYDLMKASGMFAALGQTFKGLLQILKGIFTLDFSTLGEGISNVLNGMVRSVAATFKGLGILARDAVQAIFQGLMSSVPGFSSWAMGIAETLKGIFRLDPGMILDGLKNIFDGAGTMIASGVKGWLTICANAWSAIIEVFTGQKIDLSGMLDQLWNSITETCNKIKEWVVNWISNLFSGIKLPSISDLFGGAGDLAKGAGDALGSAASGALKLGQEAGSALKEGLGKVGDFFGGLFADAGPKTEEAGAKVQDGMAQTAGAVRDGFNTAWSATRDFAVTQFQGAASTIQQIFAGIVSGIETQVGNLVLGAQRMAGQAGMIPAAAGVRAQQAGGRGNVTVNQSNRINVDARGGDPAKVQRGVERGINPGRTARAAASGTNQK